MSNVIEYNNIVAFHPGYYVEEIIEDMEISQAEFAIRLGTTPKTVSKLVNGQCNLSNDLAQKLAMMMGTGIEVWLNIQLNYEKQIFEIEKERYYEEQKNIVEMIDYSFFINNAKLPKTGIMSEKIEHLCRYFQIANLNILKNEDFLLDSKKEVSSKEIKTIINNQAWVQTAINYAKTSGVGVFDSKKLKDNLPQIRNFINYQVENSITKLKDVLAKCGVALVILPHLKGSEINSVVKWYAPNKVMLAISEKRIKSDTFWLSLFHEIKHILQKKYTMTFIDEISKEAHDIELKLENEADEFALNYLVPLKYYNKLIKNKNINEDEINNLAKEIGINPLIVISRLQHDGVLSQSRYKNLKQKFS